MSKALLNLFALTLICNFGFAAGVVGGKSHFKKMTASCEVFNRQDQYLSIEAYSLSAAKEISYALVRHYKADSMGQETSLIANYRMDYVVPKGMSFSVDFVNKKGKTALSIFADDMGRMSSLTLGKKVIELTCAID